MFSWLKGSKIVNRQTRQRRKPGLRFEGLEGRSMLAGVVDVSVSGGLLILTGDALSNGVAVVGTGVPGQFNVIGVPNVVGAGSGADTSSATTIRNAGAAPAATVLVNGVTSIYANLGDGNDQFAVTGATGAGYYGAVLLAEYSANTFAAPAVAAPAGTAAALSGSITVLGGNGNDAVALLVNTPSVISIDSGAGNDYVTVEQTVAANLAINTGAGDSALLGSDRVRVRDTAITSAIGVNTFNGSDIVDVFSSSAAAIAINTGENGGTAGVGVNPLIPEAVRIIGVTSSSVAINTAGGNDQIIVFGPVAGFSALPTNLGALAINSGEGDDLVQLQAIAIAQSLSVVTAGGNDTLTADGVTVGLNAVIDTGAGVDTVNLNALLVQYYLYLYLGDGADTATVNNSAAAYGYVFGQGGTDTYSATGSTGIAFYQ
jgi:hypothetical protein